MSDTPITSALLDSFPIPHSTFSAFSRALLPRERLPLSVWAERNIVLSPEYSNATGPLRLFGWQRAILDAFTDPAVEQLVLMTAVQMIKSLAIMCATAYVICEDPGPVLITFPKDDSARAFSKRRLTPMQRDCECLHGRLADSIHDGKNTLLGKDFPGGNLLLVSALSSTDLAQHTIRYVFSDEPDKYVANVGGKEGEGGEGDPMDLAWARALTFGSRRKRIIACSPTTAGSSRIGKAFAASDQRRPWVPCPHCGTYQVLKFRDASGPRMRWDTSLARELQPASARYYCRQCDRPWTDIERWDAVNNHTEWRADRPFAGVAGFWINHLYQPFTWKSGATLCSEFLDAHTDRQKLKVFINTALAEEWNEPGSVLDADLLYARRESYPSGDHTRAVIPDRGLFLTAFVDVQDAPPRLEVEVVAWGRGRENWSIHYAVIEVFADNGQALPVTSPELWAKLDADILQQTYLHESGRRLSIMCMGIDTGNRPKPVYEFARRHAQLAYSPAVGLSRYAIRTVVPTKGNDDPLKILSSVSKEDQARRRQGVRILSIGTHCAKQELFDALMHIRPIPDGSLSGAVSPGCYHFPDYALTYFKGLTAEVRVVKEDGKVTYEKRDPRNEPVDCKVGNRAMAAVLGIDRFGEAQWQALESAVRATGTGTATAAPAAVTPITPVPTAAQPVVAPPPPIPVAPAVPATPPSAPPALPARPLPARTTRPAPRGRFVT
jgi:phage terminase large subunit GpA-like protein